MRSWRRSSAGERPELRQRRDSDVSTSSLAPSINSTTSTTVSSTPAALSRKLLGSFAAVQSAPDQIPAASLKDPLSLVITTKNFRAFVQKAGPLFWFQDNVEATLLWDDWAWTAMWMAIWAAIALRPSLLLAAPPATLTIILYKTHRARYPNAYAHTNLHSSPPAEALSSFLQQPAQLHDDHPQPPLVPVPAAEGSMQFLQNLRDIQNMMRMIPDTYDAVSQFVPYLNWSNPSQTMLLLQLSIFTTLLMIFIAPLVPLRLILLVGGETALIANHPWIKPFLHGLSDSHPDKTIDTESMTLLAEKTRAARHVLRQKRTEATHMARTWVELDQLPDKAWSQGWRDVEMYENERYRSVGGDDQNKEVVWSGENLGPNDRQPWTRSQDGWSPPGLTANSSLGDGVNAWRVAAALPRGWEWLPSNDWRVDDAGIWSPVGTDEQGWVYTDDAWHWPAPYPYGHPGQPKEALDPSEAQATLELAQANSEQASSSSTWAQSPSRVDGSDLPLTALNKHGAAVTRRRRWLRRAVRVAPTPTD